MTHTPQSSSGDTHGGSAAAGGAPVSPGPVPAGGTPLSVPGPVASVSAPAAAPARPAPAALPRHQQPGGFRRGFGAGMGAALGVGAVLVVLSILSTVTLIGMAAVAGSSESQAASTPTRVLWGPATAKGTLYAIQVTGTIQASASEGLTLSAGTNGYEVADLIDRLKASDAGGLLLLMNTPGGTINGARAIAEAANRYRERTGKKVYAYVEGMSASGGMYAMASADRITADHGTMIGSIGVVSGPFARYKDVTATSGTLLTSGVTTTGGITYEYLTQGTGKDFGSPYRDMTPEEKAIWLKGLANEYERFVGWVAQGRKIPAETIKTQLGAHLYDVHTAKENKLVDDVLGRPQAFADAARLAGLDPTSTKVITPTAPGPFSSLLGAEKRVYGQAPAAQPVNGQPPVATSVICTGAPVVLAYHGNPRTICG